MQNIRHKIPITLFLLAFAATGALVSLKVFAASGSIYVSPASQSVQSGSELTVSIRINPGTTVDSVQGALTYDSTKLQVVSVNTSGSAFGTELTNTSSAGKVTFARGDFGSGVSTDALIESVTFKALAGSGSGSFTLTGANAASGGTFTNPSVSGGTVSFTTPAPAAPSTPSGGSTSTPSTPTSGGSTSKGSTTPSTTKSSGTTSTTPQTNSSSSQSQAASGGGTSSAAVSVASSQVQYTQATITLQSAAPTQVYIRYGLNGDLSHQTSVSDFATSHTIALDPSLLIPGESYTYVVVSTDQAGATTTSQPQTIQTKGMTLAVRIFNASQKPLRNQKVTLHSTPQTVTTDSNGVAHFTNVTPGSHHVVYTHGKSYSQAIDVANTVQDKNGEQVAALQNFSVTYAVKPGPPVGLITTLVLLFAIVGALFVLQRRGIVRLPNFNLAALGLTTQEVTVPAAPVVAAPVPPTTPAAITPPAPTTPLPSQDHHEATTVARMSSYLEAAPQPLHPEPGATVMPHTSDTQRPGGQPPMPGA